MGFLDTDTETKAEVYLDSEDHERFAHYAEKNEITEALVNGLPVVALCGKIWVPSRDPKKYPICPICKEIHDALFLAD
jgi:hypothetical protein